MKTKLIDSHFTAFWGVFLTLRCNLSCAYCIQKISLPAKPLGTYSMRTGKEWVEALNSVSGRIQPRFLRRARVKKLSILGGEPTIHPDFLYVLNNLDRHWKITVTSNFDSPFFNKDEGFKKIKSRARIRFNGSFHFLNTPVERFIENVAKLKKSNIDVHTIFVVAHPGYLDRAAEYKKRLQKAHPRVKLQRFLGFFGGNLYPHPRNYNVEQEQIDGIANFNLYQQAFGQKNTSAIYCHSDKVLIAPDGNIYNCHYKLYTAHKEKLGNLFDKNIRVRVPRDYFFCEDFGFCNPCDSEGHLFRTQKGQIKSISQV